MQRAFNNHGFVDRGTRWRRSSTTLRSWRYTRRCTVSYSWFLPHFRSYLPCYVRAATSPGCAGTYVHLNMSLCSSRSIFLSISSIPHTRFPVQRCFYPPAVTLQVLLYLILPQTHLGVLFLLKEDNAKLATAHSYSGNRSSQKLTTKSISDPSQIRSWIFQVRRLTCPLPDTKSGIQETAPFP